MADADITPKLPADFDSTSPYTQLMHTLIDGMSHSGDVNTVYDASMETLYAVERHTANAIDTLPVYIQSLGSVLAAAAASGEVNLNTVASVGWLISDLGNLLEACGTVNSNVLYALKNRAAA